MELFFNEISLHGQFQSIDDFDCALDILMSMRRAASRYNRELYCHRNCAGVPVTNDLSLQQVVQRIDRNKARALMGWFCQSGPFWEDDRRHSQDEYFESQGYVVTDTAIGECAYLEFTSRKAQLVSVAPSDWGSPSIDVSWHRNEGDERAGTLVNHCSVSTLDAELKRAAPPPESWHQLEEECRARYANLSFSPDAFRSLRGRPFVTVAAKSMLDLLDVLSRFKDEHQTGTGRTQKGHELYEQYFTGDGAWFSDSSDREKRDFENDMTFSHPDQNGATIFAPFHGKVQTPQMRIHFSWPVTADSPLYVLFVGDKITKY